MTEKIILIGGGGHCKSCIDVIENENRFQIEGILDEQLKDKLVCNYPVLGGDNLINEYLEKGIYFFITVGQIKNSLARRKIYNHLKILQISLPIIISSTAVVSKYCEVGEGSIVMHHAIINADARVGHNAIINNKALVEHDVSTGDHVHISTGAIVNGNCRVGNNVFIGSHSTINNGVRICEDVVIGSGSVVIKDIFEPGIYAGNPAKKIKLNE